MSSLPDPPPTAISIVQSSGNSASLTTLNYIRDQVESMSKHNQLEVLRILSKDNLARLNENQYGVHVNLSELNDATIHQLLQHMGHVEQQEKVLSMIELEAEKYKKLLTNKDGVIQSTLTNK